MIREQQTAGGKYVLEVDLADIKAFSHDVVPEWIEQECIVLIEELNEPS